MRQSRSHFLGLVLVQPQLLGIGILRQLAPWRETQWPREHELFLEAENLRLARGETFLAAVRDSRGILPRDLLLGNSALGGFSWIEEYTRKIANPLAAGACHHSP
jgi:hypothetical protein